MPSRAFLAVLAIALFAAPAAHAAFPGGNGRIVEYHGPGLASLATVRSSLVN